MRWGRLSGIAAGVGGLAWWVRERARAREDAERLAAAERKARWEAEAPERLRREQEAKERRRQLDLQREAELRAAAGAKGLTYEIVGLCHLDQGKKQFPTELDAQIFTWKQYRKRGRSLQRAYRCDGEDARNDDGCGYWHLTSSSSFI